MFFEEKLCLCVCGQDKIFSKSVYCGIRGIYGHEKRKYGASYSGEARK
jgi:hypothetical protein